MNEKQKARAEAIGAACQYVSGSTEEKPEPVLASDLPFIVSLAEYIIGQDDGTSPHGPDEWRLRAVRAEAALSYARAERDAARAGQGDEERPTPDSPSDVERHSKSADKWCNLYADKCEEVERLGAMFLRACAERDKWKAEFEKTDDLYSRVRNERDEAEADRNDWEDRSARNQAALWTAEAERNEWKAKFEQADTLLSWTRDERDSLRHVLRDERDTSAAREEWLRGRHESLRNDVAACRNACQIEDILYRDELWGEQP